MVSITGDDGVRLAGERVGSGRGALFAHANGFCKEVWRPVIDALPPGWAVTTVDTRGHGASQSGEPPFDWWDLGRDILAWADDDPGLRIGLGHSAGGAALAMAEILRPGTFGRLVLVEPIVFPPPFERADDHPLVRGALRRRASFATRAEARAAYFGRGPFAGWVDEALDAYVDHGFVDGADGRRHLRCAPATEAEYYRMASAHGAWDRLGEVRIPVMVVSGEHSDSHPPEFADRLASRFGDARLVVVPGASHFVPMEQPLVIGGLVADFGGG